MPSNGGPSMLEDHVKAHCHDVVRALFKRAGGHEEDWAGLDEGVSWVDSVRIEMAC